MNGLARDVVHVLRQGDAQLFRLLPPAQQSRRAFPYLVYITLAKIHGWDVRDAMVITLLEAAAICGLLLWLFLRTTGATPITALIALVLTTFLGFSPAQYDNFLRGIVFELFIPGLATILIALVQSFAAPVRC